MQLTLFSSSDLTVGQVAKLWEKLRFLPEEILVKRLALFLGTQPFSSSVVFLHVMGDRFRIPGFTSWRLKELLKPSLPDERLNESSSSYLLEDWIYDCSHWPKKMGVIYQNLNSAERSWMERIVLDRKAVWPEEIWEKVFEIVFPKQSHLIGNLLKTAPCSVAFRRLAFSEINDFDCGVPSSLSLVGYDEIAHDVSNKHEQLSLV